MFGLRKLKEQVEELIYRVSWLDTKCKVNKEELIQKVRKLESKCPKFPEQDQGEFYLKFDAEKGELFWELDTNSLERRVYDLEVRVNSKGSVYGRK